jgi:hypothetical protein
LGPVDGVPTGENQEGRWTMSLLDTMRKGLGFLLLSMGVSSPAKKPRPGAKPAPKAGEGQ